MEKTPEFTALIRQALLEDRFDEDVTTGPLSAWDGPAQAVLKAKAAGVISGLDLFAAVFNQVDAEVRVECLMVDADRVNPGDLVARITGRQSALLGAERVALNFLQHLSGVATLTRRFVDLLTGSGVTVLDTRKTTPLLRDLEKRAVRHGGGRNHRRDLASMALIKENHIEMAGSITAAVTAIRARHPRVDVEVEVKNIEELLEALSLSPQVIMLDNFGPEKTREAVALKRPGIAYEISGNVSLENIRERVPHGIDFVSIGALTHSAPALDLSLLMTRK